MKRFEDRTILVTGAGSGIGQATVARFLSEGGKLIAVDLSEKGLAETRSLAEAAGDASRLRCIALDVSDEIAVQERVGALLAEVGTLDVLVNAAGILRAEHTHKTSLELWNQVIGINLTGTFLMCRVALPYLLEQGRGVIVNFSSTSASFAHPYMAAYAASKGGIQSFTHTIALEYARKGLRAVSVAPGGIASGMTGGFVPPLESDPSLFERLSPLHQPLGQPRDVAGVIAMLASEDGIYISGTEIRIDGGTHM